MNMGSVSPLAPLAGGFLIGLSAVILMLVQGRIAGISGIVSRLLPPESDGQTAGRAAMVLGLLLAPVVYAAVTGIWPVPQIGTGIPVLVTAGLLVGFGAVWGNGCTSGHGICGLARMSPRSAVAVVVFMATAMATVFVIRHLL